MRGLEESGWKYEIVVREWTVWHWDFWASVEHNAVMQDSGHCYGHRLLFTLYRVNFWNYQEREEERGYVLNSSPSFMSTALRMMATMNSHLWCREINCVEQPFGDWNLIIIWVAVCRGEEEDTRDNTDQTIWDPSERRRRRRTALHCVIGNKKSYLLYFLVMTVWSAKEDIVLAWLGCHKTKVCLLKYSELIK